MATLGLQVYHCLDSQLTSFPEEVDHCFLACGYICAGSRFHPSTNLMQSLSGQPCFSWAMESYEVRFV